MGVLPYWRWEAGLNNLYLMEFEGGEKKGVRGG